MADLLRMAQPLIEKAMEKKVRKTRSGGLR
jgi:hypothetical protein